MGFEVVLLRTLEAFEHAYVVWLRMSMLLPELTKRLR